jgi:hypothetical protein
MVYLWACIGIGRFKSWNCHDVMVTSELHIVWSVRFITILRSERCIHMALAFIFTQFN